MPLARYQAKWKRQPPTPRIDWSDPITDGLVGLLWTGSNGARDLVDPRLAFTQTSPFAPRQDGLATSTNGAGIGVYTPRITTTGALGRWRITNAPITFAHYGELGACAATRTPVGCGASGIGYFLYSLYATNYRGSTGNIGGSARTVSGSVAWTAGRPTVKAATFTSTRAEVWDDGLNTNSTTYADTGSTIGYDASFSRLFTLGNPELAEVLASYTHWQAVWNRLLSPAEHQRLARDPWCWCVPQNVWVPLSSGTSYSFSASGSVAFSGASPLTRGRFFLPSGVVSFAGTSPFTFTGPTSYTFGASGSVAFSGAAALTRGYFFLPSGVVAFSGTSPFSSGSSASYTFTASGSVAFSGTSPLSRGRVFDISGGVTFSGAALWQKGWVFPTSGSVNFSGTANMYWTSGLASNTVDRLLKGYGV